MRDELGLHDHHLLADPSWSSYRAFGLRRGSVRQVLLSPSSWLAWARAVREGGRPGWPHEDIFELGGDALVGADGTLRWIHRSRSPADRPPIAEVARLLEESRCSP